MNKIKYSYNFIQQSFVVLIVLVLYQNCGQGFKSITEGSSSSFSYNENPSPEQLKALGILSANCKSCHMDQSLGNVSQVLNVDHLVASRLVVPGNPEGSPIFTAIIQNRMPPSGPLTDVEKNDIRAWILKLGNIQDTPAGPNDVTFDFKVSTDVSLFKTRYAKLESIVGRGAQSLNVLNTQKIFLGDYDYSRAVLPKFSWEATDIKAWMESIDPVCVDLRSRYAWPSQVNQFLMTSVGRTPSTIDQSLIQEINLMNIPVQEKFDIFCVTILTSKEFTAR